jgi:hypothetical protein
MCTSVIKITRKSRPAVPKLHANLGLLYHCWTFCTACSMVSHHTAIRLLSDFWSLVNTICTVVDVFRVMQVYWNRLLSKRVLCCRKLCQSATSDAKLLKYGIHLQLFHDIISEKEEAQIISYLNPVLSRKRYEGSFVVSRFSLLCNDCFTIPTKQETTGTTW